MHHGRPTFTESTLAVEPWADELVEQLGFDPRSAYVETFWLGVLGPSTVWLIRRLVAELDNNPLGYQIDLDETAATLGLRNNGGKHSPFMRALGRTCQFGIARTTGPASLAIRRKLPPVTQGQLRKLPESTQRQHLAYTERQRTQTPNNQQHFSRAVTIASGLITHGDDLETARTQLQNWNFDHDTADQAATTAWEQHLQH